jgi:hypothetical protein
MEQVKNSFRVALDGYQTKNAFDFVFTDFRDKYEANLKYQNNTNKNIDAQLKEIEKYTTDIKENYCLTETLDRTVRKYTLQDQFDVLDKRSKDFVLQRQVIAKFEKVNMAILQMNSSAELYVDSNFVDSKVDALRQEMDEFKKLAQMKDKS